MNPRVDKMRRSQAEQQSCGVVKTSTISRTKLSSYVLRSTHAISLSLSGLIFRLIKSPSTSILNYSQRMPETLEIESRIRAAWATFHKYRQELTSKKYMLNHRLRLFDATVSPTLCYAAGTWTLSKEHERMIQSTQRKMLRLIIQTKKIQEN